MSVVTEAAMQQVKEPHARLPRDEERDAIVRVGRGQRTTATRHPDLNQGCRREKQVLVPIPGPAWEAALSGYCDTNMTEFITERQESFHPQVGIRESDRNTTMLALGLGG